MVIRGSRTSLARARMIRSARRSRSGKVLSRSSSRNTSSRLNSSSQTQRSSETKQTKKIAMYEEVQKAADDLQKVAKSLIELGAIKAESSTTAATTTTTTTETASTTADASKTADTTTTAQPKEKTEEEQKKEIIAGVKELVEQYNIIYENLEELGGSVNTVFLSKVKQLVGNCEEELKKTGVSMNRNGTLSITTKTLESADLNTLKSVYCKSNGLTDKLMERAEYIESNAASTIEVMNRMYGTQTYNKYGTSNSYYGSNGSWYSALG